MARTLALFSVFVLLVGTACGNGDVAPVPDAGDPGFRPEGPNPPGFDAGNDGTNNGENNGQNNGETDAGDNNGSNNGTCCMIGERRCQAAGFQECADDGSGCGAWGEIVDCTNPGEACVRGYCEVPDGCVDNDNDTFGVQCAAGPDCNDTDDSIHPGANEVCDEVDNDCDGQTDEDLGKGMTCTIGGGACMSTGTNVCGPTGGVTCDAQPPTGAAETCDGVDNDCDGVVDNGVCTLCAQDMTEPNDMMGQAIQLSPGNKYIGLLCPSETDWIELQVLPGTHYRFTLAFPEVVSDVKFNGYVDGGLEVSFDAMDDGDVIYVDGDAGTDFHIEVINKDAKETYFRAGLVELSTVRCTYEDYFAPNQRIQDAFPFIPGWVVSAYMCHSNGAANRVSDWWALGEVMNGQSITIQMQEYEGAFTDYDLDLYLWGDPDGDGTYTQMAKKDTFSDFETLTYSATHTGNFYLEVRDYNGDGADYDLGWIFN